MRHATEKDLKILEKLEFGGDIGLDDVAELSANEFTSLLKLNAKWNIKSFGELLVRDAKAQMKPKKGIQTLQRPAFEVRIQNWTNPNLFCQGIFVRIQEKPLGNFSTQK